MALRQRTGSERARLRLPGAVSALLGAAVLAAMALPAPPAAAATGTAPLRTGRLHPARVGPPRHVTLSAALPAVRPPAAWSPPHLGRRPGNRALRRPAATAPAGHPTVVTLPAPAGKQAAASAPAPASAGPSPGITVANALTLMSERRQLSQYAGVAPPDTQVAVGTNAAHPLLEMINDTGSVWSYSGGTATLQGSAIDLAVLFGIPSGWHFTDPRVLFDAPTGRFFATGLAFDGTGPTQNDSETYVAVSAGDDPAAGWTVFTVADHAHDQVLADQPRLGVSADKVVMTWDDYVPGALLGDELWVLEKSDLLAGVQPRAVSTTYDWASTGIFGLVAGVGGLDGAGSGNDAWVAFNNADPYTASQTTGTPTLGVVRLTGLPSDAQGVSTVLSYPDIAPTAPPPPAAQPGTGATLDTNDDRLLNVTVRGGHLWTGLNDDCGTAAGDVACTTVVDVDLGLSGPGPAVHPGREGSFVLSGPGAALIYPAETVDAAGDAVVAVTAVAPQSLYPSAAAFTLGAAGPLQPPAGTLAAAVIATGGRSYAPAGCATAACRWGDYSAAVLDPDGTHAWVAAEYAGASGAADDFGTAAARLATGGAVPPPALGLTTAPEHSLIGVEGQDGSLWGDVRLSGFEPLGGGLLAAPGLATYFGTPLLLATGTDHNLWERNDTQDWQPLGGRFGCVDSPAATTTADSGSPTGMALVVACTGTDGDLWMGRAPAPSGGGLPVVPAMQPAGGILRYGPALAVVDGTLTAMGVGLDNRVWSWTATGGWVSTGWGCIGHPALASAGAVAYFACHGLDGAAWVAVRRGGRWGAAFSLGGALVDGVGVAAGPSAAAVVVEGTDAHVWAAGLGADGTAGPFTPVGGLVLHGAAATAF